MAFSVIQVSKRKPKTYDALTRLQQYVEKNRPEGREDETPAAWRDVQADLRASMTPENYARWIGSAQVRQEGDRLIIGSPDDFSRSWLQERLGNRIDASLQRMGHGHLAAEYAVTPADPRAPRIIVGRDDWAGYTRHHLDERGLKPRQGKETDRYNSPLAIHYTVSASHAWFAAHPEQKEAWITHSAGFIRQLHGDAQVLGMALHEHQTTPHLHIVAIPIDARGRLSASSFTRTPEQLEALHTLYNRHLRDHGIQLERGQSGRLERQLAAATPAVRETALRADDIPLDEVLERLDAERDGRDSNRWLIGDRIIQVDREDAHHFTELGPHGAEDGHGAIDLVIRLRQEGRTPAEEYGLAVGYLAVAHADRVTGSAPPLVPPAPNRSARPTEHPDGLTFGAASQWEPGQLIVVDSPVEALQATATAKGWGRIVVSDDPAALPVDQMDEAIAKGWMVDVATRSDALWDAVQEHYADETEAAGRQVFRSPAPGGARARAAEHAMGAERGPDMGPQMVMDA